jgi:hypothetical protein
MTRPIEGYRRGVRIFLSSFRIFSCILREHSAEVRSVSSETNLNGHAMHDADQRCGRTRGNLTKSDATLLAEAFNASRISEVSRTSDCL